MVDIHELSPGMRVKIIDRWGQNCNQNPDGCMDKYLGKIVTILEVLYDAAIATIEEDTDDGPRHQEGHWRWNKYCFDYIVCDEDESEDFEPPTESEILSLIFQN